MSFPSSEKLAFLQSLPPAPAYWGGTGAVPLLPDARDYPATHHPDVRAALSAGVPDSYDISNSVCEILNQGSTGACVAFSTCHGVQVNNNRDNHVCYHFAADQLYRELGGTGSNGVDSRATLQRCEDVGAPTSTGARVRTGSYFWIDQTPGSFEAQIKAALSTGHAVVIALLLPSTFSGVWTPGSVTQGYHQLCMAKYGQKGNPDLFAGPNSWGSSWGANGFYELSFNYVLEAGLQHNYCFAYFFDTAIIAPPPPPPPPAQAATVGGRAQTTGAGAAVWPKVGDTVPFGQNVALTVNTLIYDGVPPIPVPPVPTPGVLHVTVQSGPHHILAATIQDDTGKYLEGTCTAIIANTNLGSRPTHPQGATVVPAVWTTVGWLAGSPVTVNAVTADGRTGTGSGVTS